MSEWKGYSIEELFQVQGRIGWKGYKRTDLVDSGPIVVGGREINSELFLDLSDVKHLSRVKYEESPEIMLKPEDVLVVCRGNLAEVGIYHKEYGEGTLNPSVVLLRSRGVISPLYGFYYLSSSIGRAQLLSISSGSSVPAIYQSSLKTLQLPVPDRDTQNGIVEILKSLDDKIDLLHRQNRTLEQMAETLFRQWFVEEADEGWEEVNIESLFEVRDGTHDSPKKQELGKKLITSRHLKPNYIDFKNAYFISEEDYLAVNKRSKVEKGDILFSMIGTIGNLFLEESDSVDYAIKNIGLFKTSQNPKWRYFTYLWLKSDLGSQFIHENRSGSTQEYISLGNLRSIAFYVESESQVSEFNSVVNQLFKKIKSNQTQIRTLTALRDTLLPKLMSGEVRVDI